MMCFFFILVYRNIRSTIHNVSFLYFALDTLYDFRLMIFILNLSWQLKNISHIFFAFLASTRYGEIKT